MTLASAQLPAAAAAAAAEATAAAVVAKTVQRVIGDTCKTKHCGKLAKRARPSCRARGQGIKTHARVCFAPRNYSALPAVGQARSHKHPGTACRTAAPRHTPTGHPVARFAKRRACRAAALHAKAAGEVASCRAGPSHVVPAATLASPLGRETRKTASITSSKRKSKRKRQQKRRTKQRRAARQARTSGTTSEDKQHDE